MKVNNNSINAQTDRPQKLSREELKERVMAKFGKQAEAKKIEPIEDKVEIHSNGVKNSNEEGFGDIGKNKPDSEVTKEKLRTLLKAGGFEFNDRERKALNEILN